MCPSDLTIYTLYQNPENSSFLSVANPGCSTSLAFFCKWVRHSMNVLMAINHLKLEQVRNSSFPDVF
jgi:L-asparagine transporter-like permease